MQDKPRILFFDQSGQFCRGSLRLEAVNDRNEITDEPDSKQPEHFYFPCNHLVMQTVSSL